MGAIRRSRGIKMFAEGFDDALIGTAEVWAADRLRTVAAYDTAKMLGVLVKRDGMSEEEAEEYLDLNTFGAYMGPMTPVYLTMGSEGG